VYLLFQYKLNTGDTLISKKHNEIFLFCLIHSIHGFYQFLFVYFIQGIHYKKTSVKKKGENLYRACVIVAHPDDETLWAGGTIIMHPECLWEIYTLCRASDLDRTPKYFKALSVLNASGEIADLDDGSAQEPLPEIEVQNQVLEWVEGHHYDLLISHGPNGEYTQHRRHEETSRAVKTLWENGRIDATELWLFAYGDGGRAYLPRAEANAPVQFKLPIYVWEKKYYIINEIYGFNQESWEARTTPKVEAFWSFNTRNEMSNE